MPAAKISVIIPVFNATPFVEKCVRSVMNQTLKEIEIILVNDGSTDNSLSILNALAKEDSRLQVFSRENKGVSSARNFGLEKAKGEFIAFADADDWLEPSMYESLYKAIKENNCDWAICNVNVIIEDLFVKTRLNLQDEVVDLNTKRIEALHQLMRFKYDNANWNKLFNTALIKEHHLRFDEGITIWEDLLFNLSYLHFAEKIAVVAAPLYNYRIHGASLYSTNRDLIPQFNLLYKNYMKFAAASGTGAETEAFKKGMAQLTYNQLLDMIEKKSKKESPSFIHLYRDFNKNIRHIDPDIFYYGGNEIKGIRGLKKRLLNKRIFSLFSFIIACKRYLK
jgi:glycosyltransferase involved in cell wall biosynthesis